jgi:hypothetical protein
MILMAPWVGIEPTTNGLTGRISRSLPHRCVRNQRFSRLRERLNPAHYTPVQLAGKHLGNKRRHPEYTAQELVLSPRLGRCVPVPMLDSAFLTVCNKMGNLCNNKEIRPHEN